MLESTAAPTRAEKAFEIRLPQNRMALRVVSSRFVYHFDKMRRALEYYISEMNLARKQMQEPLKAWQLAFEVHEGLK